jgi:hypothetical protein
MDYRELTEEQYYARIRIVIVRAEGVHAWRSDVLPNISSTAALGGRISHANVRSEER